MDSKLYPILNTLRSSNCSSKDTIVNNLIKMEMKCPSRIEDINLDIISKDESNTFKSDPFLDDDIISDGLFEKNNVLQARWNQMQQKLYQMTSANQKLKEFLNEEKMRAETYKVKFQYLQENQPAFEKLKQVYKILKYNEQQNRSIIDVGEKECQTKSDHNIVDSKKKEMSEKSTVTDDYLMDDYIQQHVTKYDCDVAPGYIPVKKEEFHGMRNTFDELKDLLVSQPLKAFVLSENKEAKYRKDISDLFMENRILKQLVIDQQMELDKLKEQASQRKTPKEVNFLKKIIAKQRRHMKNCNACIENNLKKSRTNLNEIEGKIVDHIYAKYELKLLQKLKPELTPKSRPNTPFYTPRSGGTNDTYRSCDGTLGSDSISLSFDSV